MGLISLSYHFAFQSSHLKLVITFSDFHRVRSATTLWTIKGHPFYFGNNLAKCWPNFTIFGRNVAEKICNIFMSCCSPHLLSGVTLPQENKVPSVFCRARFVCWLVYLLSSRITQNVMYKNFRKILGSGGFWDKKESATFRGWPWSGPRSDFSLSLTLKSILHVII